MNEVKPENVKKQKYSKDDFKKDVEEAVVKGVKSAKPKKKGKAKKKSKYADFATKELY